MTQRVPERQRAIDAVDLLNEFIGDLVTGANVLRDCRGQFDNKSLPPIEYIPIYKMCMSHLILTLTRWSEFYGHYKDLIPAAQRAASQELRKEIHCKRLREFRNKCIGHIWDKDRARPLFLSDVNSRLSEIIGADLHAFLNWINPVGNKVQQQPVVRTVEAIRDALVARYSITEAEVFGR